ncbi:MAG: sulfide dehydrogenase [Gammaproteobacteria bacterium]|nr:sulfide dehydrogenase [Gammaproteobacteria bacterium]MYF27407.1 sulfide dehydrogenase [Gammaproteobacteria bacterium]MYK48604.1 sulfide dehydrogenase [Gammaproteobacteria bacterium]
MPSRIPTGDHKGRAGDHKGRPYGYGRRCVGLALFIASCLASSIVAETGEQLADRLCVDCHGEFGRSETKDIPSIGGFSEFAIMDLLESYRLGFRKARAITLDDGSENDMQQVVDALSDEEIETVAVYYSAQEWRPHDQVFDAELARRGAAIHSRKCGKCHPKGGSVPDADHALLAGQWRDYLARELRNFTSGKRRMADKMKKKFDTLSESDKAALLELYVSAGDY